MKREDIWRGMVLGLFLTLIVVSLEIILFMPLESSVPTGLATGGQARYGCPVASGYVSACFMNPLYKSEYKADHGGMDFGGCCGVAVVALADGQASFRVMDGSYGNKVHIVHDDGWQSRYAHLVDFGGRAMRNAEGRVKAGEVIGHVGGSGKGDPNYWPCHLHYEIFNGNGNRVDPWYHSCWDKSYGNSNGAYCSNAQKNQHNPSGAVNLPTVAGSDYSTVDGTISPLSATDLSLVSIVPLVAELDPNTYSVNPSYTAEIDYSLKEYEALSEFAKATMECQNGQPQGINPCIKDLFANWVHDEFSFTFRISNCVEDYEINPEGYGTYELCAVSEFVLPYAADGVPPDNYAVSYAFAVKLEDNDGPPRVGNLQATPTGTSSVQPVEYKVSWDPPTGCEDVELYVVNDGATIRRVEDTSFTLNVDEAFPVEITVTPYDYSGNRGTPRTREIP